MRLILLLFFIGYVHCKKTYQPLDKNANIAFINREGGGAPKPAAPGSSNNQQPQTQLNQPVKPSQPSQPAKILPPNSGATTSPPPKPIQAIPTTVKPVQPSQPNPIQPPKPVQPSPSKSNQSSPTKSNQPSPTGGNIGATTPGPGSVKQLVAFYDSQGKASPIRPYSYSQAVKQGKQ